MPSFHIGPMVTTMKWLAPKSGWVKLNTNGAVSLNSYLAAIKGVIRDVDGNWFCGYLIVLGKDEVFKIETRSMLERLHLLWDKGCRQVELECDNTVLVEIILVGEAIDSHFTELRAIHKLI
ncbi:hypothetical protein J1N35_041361 [Gossypium stocksii]|uniref:RNase H type-1 domain-containing protein n=1 Tax=Gossypium stocksii TaxID=47602 RepID=A0A9D3UFV1_9ROSI|nr:hypothetical protein J1N35_041361 [Gossypium stocksii]